MERTIHIEDRKFSSVAEAVAHYYRQGFHDFDTGRGTNRRIMRSGDLFVRVNDWSTTTGKHLNAIDGGNKKARIAGDKFEAMLAQQVGGCVFGKAA